MALADYSASSIQSLQAAIGGQVIAPKDPEYDAARTIVYGGFDLRPEAIVKVANVADVKHVIGFARKSGLPLAVRSGGHSGAGHGGRGRDRPRPVAPEGRRDRRRGRDGLGGGRRDGRRGTVAARRARAGVGFGDTGSVGIGGLTLGGGVGYLVRKHGLTIDGLLGAES